MATVGLSVVIPCLNAADEIGAQLERLAQERWSEPWEIIVADNGSTDATREIVRRYQDRIEHLRLVDASDRPGASHARNVGVAAADGEYIAFCDADDEVQPGWLAAMGEALRRHDLVAGRLEFSSLNAPWSVALREAWQDERLATFARHLTFAAAGNLGVRRSLHERVGGFDEDFVGGGDDTDYCWRLQRAGAKIHFEPRAVVSYRLRHDPRSLFRQGRFYAIGTVSLFKKYRKDLPRQRHPWLLGVLTWLGVFKALPLPPNRRTLARFAWILGYKFGLLEGSIRKRIVLLSIRGID
jgi:GT2 family glycosyltransferase